ncbi:MAG TPA: hypothetical protein VFU05_07955 [Cyclobacteriaceae bacterium]|nr:hypothetical protein [Cyclobacteriaceae bacterium]
MKRKAAILLLATAIAGCDDSNEFNIAENNFFPLQVGNYWELYPPDQNPLNEQVVVKMEITDTQLFSGIEYFLMVTRTETPNGVYADSTYYRVDENGFVFKRLKTGEISNPYRLGAGDGSRWSSSVPPGEKDMQVDYYTTPVEINTTHINGCRLFSFNVDGIIDEEHWTTLAPNIGIVTMHSAWGFRRDLKKAIINGVEYNF